MKKIGLLCLALVLALGTMGVGYALWYEDLFISGTVETGTLDVDWSLNGEPTDNEIAGKDVSHGEFSITGNTLYIHIYNAYPCITYTFPIDIHGVGSVPAHLCPLFITGGNMPAGAVVTFPNWDDVQLHAGDTEYGVITVHLDNRAAQDADYWFTATLRAHQYNEDGQCPD